MITLFGFPSRPTRALSHGFAAAAMHIFTTEEMVEVAIIFLLF
jgi:hypothetical protein